MRDYFKVFTVIYYDSSAPPPATRVCAFFETQDEAVSFVQSLNSSNPNVGYDLANWRWWGFNKNIIVKTLNAAYQFFGNTNLFVQGTKQSDFGGSSIDVFVESPRRQGFNSALERPGGSN